MSAVLSPPPSSPSHRPRLPERGGDVHFEVGSHRRVHVLPDPPRCRLGAVRRLRRGRGPHPPEPLHPPPAGGGGPPPPPQPPLRPRRGPPPHPPSPRPARP